MIGRTTSIGSTSGGAVAAANELAAAAGAGVLSLGGNAVDAAIAAAAAMAVTSPHMCGLGGDLFAIIARPGERPIALNASGRAGSGADPDRLRRQGHTTMPFQHDIRSVTVPGLTAGLVALHERYGSLTLGEALAPAIRLAHDGFPVSPTLALASTELSAAVRATAFGTPAALGHGDHLELPRIADVLGAIASRGAPGFYQGPAGEDLLSLGEEFTEEDLRGTSADWVEPLALPAFDRTVWTAPPNSQGYVALSSAWIAERLDLPPDPSDATWAFLLVEAARQAAHDRLDALHEHTDGTALLAASRLAPRAAAVRGSATHGLADTYADGDTTSLCVIDEGRTGVSLIMSNAADFGSHLVLPRHGIFLQNRGMGFCLQPGHPSEYQPRRRPPHTLAPLLVTTARGELDMVLGTMGGDAQPQILLQLLVRMLALSQGPEAAVKAPRWVLTRPRTTHFDTWHDDTPPHVRLEHHAPATWRRGLSARGYQTVPAPPDDQYFGHAQVLRIQDGQLAGAADPRAGNGAVTAARI